jgi:predicted HD superfamily hydrolase involved in NAD metabolism
VTVQNNSSCDLTADEVEVEITDAERENLELLHAKLGAEFAADYYEIDDEEILSAIRCHTTGKADMSPLEEILFIADYIEPNRKELPGMDEVRFLAFHDRTSCIVKIIENTLKYLEGKKSLIDDASRETYEYYIKKQESNNA